MSNLGFKILYMIINNTPFAKAERIFAPWSDKEAYLRKENIPLSSLETSIPLNKFDIVGFTLQYELSFTTILNMLELGKLN
ncbi:radical SAM protein, partial [Candidatus Magnetoovum chiemensis]